MQSIYLIGSLRNPSIPLLGKLLRTEGFDVFDDWFAAGPEADDHWQKYEKERGRTMREALKGYAAMNVYNFDKRHLDRVDAVVLVAPAGKSGHMELLYCAGKGKPAYVLFPDGDPERWDVMYQFVTDIFYSTAEMVARLKDTDIDDGTDISGLVTAISPTPTPFQAAAMTPEQAIAFMRRQQA